MTDNIDTEIWVEDYLTDLIDHTALDISIEELSIDENEVLCIQLGGPDSARIIGREGNVLDALQHLVVSSAVHNGISDRRILIDVEHYRERREQRILDEASRLANEALDTGTIQETYPMSSRERRLVHMVVSKISGVRTESLGEDPDRYVKIIPSKR
jgi:spoIIIJ-associated protein